MMRCRPGTQASWSRECEAGMVPASAFALPATADAARPGHERDWAFAVVDGARPAQNLFTRDPQHPCLHHRATFTNH